MTPPADHDAPTCPDYMPMSSTCRSAPHTLHVSGELDIYRAQALKDELLTALAAGSSTLILDLSAVTALDSAGVQLLLAARAHATAAGGALRLQAPSAAVNEVLACLGLSAHFAPPAH